MPEQIYYSIFTQQGLELLAESIQNGTKLGITSMAFGDGGGELPLPDANFEKLVNEVYRTQLNSISLDPDNKNWLRTEAVISSAIGGFNIRELGLYSGDILVAYSNYPSTYKPNPADGTARIMTFRMVLQIDNSADFELVIDPDIVLATRSFVEDRQIYVPDFGVINGYIDDALDKIKIKLANQGPMSGGTLHLPKGTWRVKRSHDLSVTGLRILGAGGRYATRIIADKDGNYSEGYIFRVAPSSGNVISNGSGLEKITIDCNEAPAVGLHYLGAYDTSALELVEVINAHDNYEAAIIEPHEEGTVIQTLKIDTCAFAKKNIKSVGYTVIIRKAQECLSSNSKYFGAPSNNIDKGAIPLLLEDVRGITLIGGGYANSETHCIDIYAKTRNVTHINLISPTFEGYKSKAIRTRANEGFYVSRLNISNERLIQPSAGLLLAESLTFSTIYSSHADIELSTGASNNIIHTFDRSKIIDNGSYNIIFEGPNSLNSNRFTLNRQHSLKLKSTPTYNLEVSNRSGRYGFQWSASENVDNGACIVTPNNSQPIRFNDDMLGFFNKPPVPKRTISGTTFYDVVRSIAQSIGDLGLAYNENTLGGGVIYDYLNNVVTYVQSDAEIIDANTFAVGTKYLVVNSNQRHLNLPQHESQNTWLIETKRSYSGQQVLQTAQNYYTGEIFVRAFITSWSNWKSSADQSVKIGPTASRPNIGLYPGRMYYDETLNKPIWYKENGWVDANGVSV
ncbi:phage tail-collar fiber domain-containing protein [Acinetobacter baumannii]|nr:phage tail protein [Acinetobacter baumannii]MDC4929877.1 phage tail protein [Acinetobacter baumannii]MDC4968718.1 phage tail protein [Acinetobacter baumannii]